MFHCHICLHGYRGAHRCKEGVPRTRPYTQVLPKRVVNGRRHIHLNASRVRTQTNVNIWRLQRCVYLYYKYYWLCVHKVRSSVYGVVCTHSRRKGKQSLIDCGSVPLLVSLIQSCDASSRGLQRQILTSDHPHDGRAFPTHHVYLK